MAGIALIPYILCAWVVAHRSPIVGEFQSVWRIHRQMYQQVPLGQRVARFAGTAANQGTLRDVVFGVGDSSRGYTGQTHRQ